MHYNAFADLDAITLTHAIGEDIYAKMHHYCEDINAGEECLNDLEREEYLSKRQITGLKLSEYDASPSFDFHDDYKGTRSVPFTPTLYGSTWVKPGWSRLSRTTLTAPSLDRVIAYQRKYGAFHYSVGDHKAGITQYLPTYEDTEQFYADLPPLDWPVPRKHAPTQLQRRAKEQLDSLLPRTPKKEKEELVTGWLENYDRVANVKRAYRRAKAKNNKAVARRSLTDALENARKRSVARKLASHRLHYKANDAVEAATIVIEDVSDTETIDVNCHELIDWGEIPDQDLVVAYEQAMGEREDPERYDYNPWEECQPNVVTLPQDYTGSQPMEQWAFASPPSDDSDLAIASRLHAYTDYTIEGGALVNKQPTLDVWLSKH